MQTKITFKKKIQKILFYILESEDNYIDLETLKRKVKLHHSSLFTLVQLLYSNYNYVLFCHLILLVYKINYLPIFFVFYTKFISKLAMLPAVLATSVNFSSSFISTWATSGCNNVNTTLSFVVYNTAKNREIQFKVLCLSRFPCKTLMTAKNVFTAVRHRYQSPTARSKFKFQTSFG